MWYVNLNYLYQLIPLLYSFILTMWYVNFIPASSLSNQIISFILTMWYVNFNKLIEAMREEGVLY